MKNAYTYILANYCRTIFHIGSTEDIDKRTVEHKDGSGSNYTREHLLIHLVYFENLSSLSNAIIREKQLRHMNQEALIDLIKSANPKMEDLSNDPKIKLGF